MHRLSLGEHHMGPVRFISVCQPNPTPPRSVIIPCKMFISRNCPSSPMYRFFHNSASIRAFRSLPVVDTAASRQPRSQTRHQRISCSNDFQHLLIPPPPSLSPGIGHAAAVLDIRPFPGKGKSPPDIRSGGTKSRHRAHGSRRRCVGGVFSGKLRTAGETGCTRARPSSLRS